MRRHSRSRILVLIVGCLCIIVMAIVLMNLEPPVNEEATSADIPAQEPAIVAAPTPPKPSEPVESTATPAQPLPLTELPENGATETIVNQADLTYLRTRKLLVPVSGVTPGQLRDSYNDVRSEGRTHQALDIRAPQGTEVLATTDGVTARLFSSERGGTTLYEIDSSGLFVYYYGHLQRYADGIYEGKPLRRGDVIGYVGDTGNAGAGNYHLHFGISKLKAPGKWSGGEPINPYSFLTAK